jgi:two-component system chemotaxis sensor kinase CheA
MTPIDVDRNALARLLFEASHEGLATMEEALVNLEASPGQSDALKALCRAAHTLKGNAASLGFSEIAEMTHELENVLDCLRGGSLAVQQAGDRPAARVRRRVARDAFRGAGMKARRGTR